MSYQKVCDICGEEKITLYKCERCGASFCVKCGDRDIPLCTNCLVYNKE